MTEMLRIGVVTGGIGVGVGVGVFTGGIGVDGVDGGGSVCR